MSVVQKGSSVSGPVGIPEVSTTSSPEEFSRRMRLSHPGGIQKASRELETIQKLSRESVLST